jgi:hypothetical protein
MEQETLEEASIRLVPNRTLKTPFGTPYEITPTRERNTFKKGAKWQQERSYTLEQISELFIPIGKNGYIDDYLDYRLFNKEQPKLNFKEWFEQFKKK